MIFLYVVIFLVINEFKLHAILEAQWSVEGAQTVPRAEISAVLHFWRHTKGKAVVHIDCLSVLKTLHKMQQNGWEPNITTPNGRLWGDVCEAARARGGSRELVFWKVKAHFNEEEARQAGYTMEAWAANKEADRLADGAAEAASYDKATIERIKEADQKAEIVLDRLLLVHNFTLEQYKSPDREHRAEKPTGATMAKEVGLANQHNLRIRRVVKCITCGKSPQYVGQTRFRHTV